jgi:hypothetical protein
MDTSRVDICYRPLRIAWAIQSTDREAFREAIRLTHTMWGGRFNPIALVDQPEEARRTIEAFRAVFVVPVGTADEVRNFPAQFPHLINPLLPKDLFLKHAGQTTRAHVLDMHNALLQWRDTSGWKSLTLEGVMKVPGWADDDPLADAFLVQYAGYPDPAIIGIDYHDMLSRAVLAIQLEIHCDRPLPAELLSQTNLNYLSRYGLYRHHTVRPGWDHPGLFVGDVTSIEDLVAFWNLRAADIWLQFVDPNHWDRYAQLLPAYINNVRETVQHLAEHRQRLAVWTQEAHFEDTMRLLGNENLVGCRVGPGQWLGGAWPPMMIFGEESSLGVYGTDRGKPRVSFAFHTKPFNGDVWFYTQHLVASVRLSGGDEEHTFHPPYVPEWNEFYSREMHFQYDRLRIEPERIGIVIDAADHDAFLFALPVGALVEKLFDSAGMTAKLSGGGLITRQLISRVGGIQGARVFKIPGVRRLLKTYGLNAAFTRNTALQLIGRKDAQNPAARFSDHDDLYIESRPIGTKLTPAMVFEYLVEKGLFRIGVELTCPTCRLSSWITLDALRQANVCELCGASFDGTRQLVNSEYRYRRSGVLGLERNAQGAVPVALVLQQLSTNLEGLRTDPVHASSYNLTPKAGVTLPGCEIDFLMMIPDHFPQKPQVLLGECKDEAGHIDTRDVEHLRQVADAIPSRRFETYIIFAKLAQFTPEEIALVKTLNGPYQNRVILLTARELEPYHIYERTEAELGIQSYGSTPEELASVTVRIYFTDPPEDGGT